MPPHERKFTQRSRLFIGNLPLDMTEEEFKKLFQSYGEISETFINADKGFGFVRLVCIIITNCLENELFTGKFF